MSDHDFIVVGSGVAGLVGAINAHRSGLRPLIVERADVWGGTSAISGGVLWIPGNTVMARDGTPDSIGEARRLLVHLMEGEPTGRETARIDAFLAAGPRMADVLAGEGIRWTRNAGHPDYYPGAPGERIGRGIEAALVDGALLGARLDTMRARAIPLPAFDTRHSGKLTRVYTGVGPLLTGAFIVARHKLLTWLGKRPLGLGRALVASLMAIAQNRGIPLLLGTRMIALEEEDGRVTGIRVADADGERVIEAPAGVLIASGGFARNAALRQARQGLDGRWSNAIAEDQGDALVAGEATGAATALTDDAWWMPTIMVAEDQPSITLGERTLPGGLFVDEHARRYMNEAQSYKSGGAAMRAHGAAHETHWLICDSRFVKRYVLRVLSSAATRRAMAERGLLHSADTIEELAGRCGLPPEQLRATVDRFNGFARASVDADFGRGSSDYDRFWADPAHGPNPSLGVVDRAPFYAVPIRLGDLGTNGGLMTDDRARVLDTTGRPIVGLYAAGNASASPFGTSYPGGGATLSAAAVFGFIAAEDAAVRYNRGEQHVPG